MSESKKIKPKIEDVINEILSGDAQENALNFVAYLRKKKMNPQWSAANAWKVSSKTFGVCFIRLHGSAEYHRLELGSWNITPFIGEYDGNSLSNEMKEVIWANKKNCQTCSLCALPVSSIFGKKFATSCECSICFKNPNAEAVECAKKLVELRRDAIKAGMAKKHVYVAVKDRK